MGDKASRSVAIPALAVLLVGAVVADVVWRAVHRTEPSPLAAPGRAGAAGEAAGPGVGADATSRVVAASLATADRLDSSARAAALRRIDEEGDRTYLPAMLASGDSALHRWADDRASRPLRVAVLREAVPGFREDFVANVGWAVARWNGAGLPVWLEQTGDTAAADIVVSWVERLDSNRTGRADVTWQGRGPITQVHITLATHTPDGEALLPGQMVALALHELGHALGLGHSPVASDALYRQTSATELTPRDRRTASVLYSLPAGSFR